MNGKVKVLTSGFLTTIQDEGRFGFSKYGVPKSGAMDQLSYHYANLLLNNDPNAACVEWVLQPPTLQFFESCTIVLSGAIIDAFLNDKKIEMYRCVHVHKNDVLKFNFCKTGIYGYVGIKGGFLSKEILTSRSYYKTVTDKFLIAKGDEINYPKTSHENNSLAQIVPPSFNETYRLKCYKGPEFGKLTIEQQKRIINSSFTVSNTSNRMAIQLEERVLNDLDSILTSGVLPGTVQLTPSGKLIVLMRDCQTTGGYPRVLQLTEDSINKIAQKRMGENVLFDVI